MDCFKRCLSFSSLCKPTTQLFKKKPYNSVVSGIKPLKLKVASETVIQISGIPTV
jgi:hypothetical protein